MSEKISLDSSELFTQNRNASLDFLHLLYFINFASSNQTGKKKNEEQI